MLPAGSAPGSGWRQCGSSRAPQRLQPPFAHFAVLGFLMAGKTQWCYLKKKKKSTLKVSCQVLHEAPQEDKSSWGPCRDTVPEQMLVMFIDEQMFPPHWATWEAQILLETLVSRCRSRR